MKEENQLLKLKHDTIIKNERLRTVRAIFCQKFSFCKLNSDKRY